MWGAMAINGVQVDPNGVTPSSQIMKWVHDGFLVKAVPAAGRYLDIGTVESLRSFYGHELGS
jgi:hypothetical protein